MKINGKAWLLIFTLGGLWLGMTAFDWISRFRYFRWHEQLIYREVAMPTAGPMRPLTDTVLPVASGGDLTRLTALPAFTRIHGEEKSPSHVRSDEFGFANIPPTDGRYYPVVVTGDSYMYAGYPFESRFSALLAERGGIDVYDHSVPGRGPFWALNQFVSAGRFAERMPKVLVWGFVERDISGDAFAGMVYLLERSRNPETAIQKARHGMVWPTLAPATLRSALPNTSRWSLWSKDAWNVIRYALLGRITPDVILSTPLPDGQPTLFYRLSLEAMAWPDHVRDPEKVVWAISHLSEYLESRGTSLCILLIPDKEQVYREFIPPSAQPPAEFPPSVLNELESRLRDRGILVVNMLSVFREAVRLNQQLYWRDDTHWHPEGIALAAEAVWREIVPVMEGK